MKLTSNGKLSRDRIFEAATRVVATEGIENASVTAICGLAGVSRGLLAYYLPKKDQLLLALVRYVLEEGGARFPRMEVARTRVAVPESIEARIRRNFEFFGKNRHYFQLFMLFFYRASYDRACRRLNSEIYRAVVDDFAAALESRATPAKTARKRAAQIYGMMFFQIQRMHLIDRSEVGDRDQALDELFDSVEDLLVGWRRP